ncbi:uncharacterized protein LOC120341917 [Styela clava]
MASTVEVRLELGHKAKVRDVPSPEGHTHDWEVFVKGTGIKIEYFVEKVVFWLHDSYEPPGRVIKHPPYKVKESGFAGFNMLIDVHFRNKEAPKNVRFQYDLFLHTESMPPVNHTRLEKLTFTNPTEDFRKKLLSAGAVLGTASPESRHSSKDRSSRTTSPSSKKELSKSRDSSKHRESSKSNHPERKRSSSHSKKDGRIAVKDMKKHDENFKLPKNLSSSEKRPKEEGSEKSETYHHERGRPEKRRSVAGEDDGNKKKKKKHSDDAPQRPKSLNVSSGPTPNTQKKDKEKIRRIKEKPDLMAGLFAPGNSINMTQIKQSKVKQEDMKIKKEKGSSSTPSRNSPHPSTQEEANVVHSAKISPGGNLTLKIKREKVPSTEKDKNSKESVANPIQKSKRRGSVEKERKHHKDSSSKTKVSEKKQEFKKMIMSSDSSSSGSDMDISESDTSADEKRSHKIKVHIPNVEEKPKTKIKTGSNVTKESLKPKLEKKSISTIVKQEPKVKTENSSHTNSPSYSKPVVTKEKSRKNSVSKKERSDKVSMKHKKSSKDPDKDHSERESTPSNKPKKHKRSSKEKVLIKQSSKDEKRFSPLGKDKKLSSTPNTERIAPKKKSESHSSPISKNLEASSPASVTKNKKISSPKPSNRQSKSPKSGSMLITKEKDSSSKKEFHKRPSSVPSKKPSSKLSQKREEKPKPVYKSRSYVETSSDDSVDSDAEIPPPIAHKDIPKKITPIRKASISSQSSAFSGNHSVTSDDEKNHVAEKNTPISANIARSNSSSSSDSSDDELNMSGLPLENTAHLSVISPIRDSHTEHTIDATTAYQDMEMSDSSDDSSYHEPVEENKHQMQENITEYPVSEVKVSHEDREKKFQNLGLSNNFDTSSEDESDTPLEKPFQSQREYSEPSIENDTRSVEQQGSSTELPIVVTKVGNVSSYPRMNDTLYQELQELQRKISYVTDVDRLRKIASIVAKSKKLVRNEEYFDFDLCSLDNTTINKIQKHLKAV